MYRLLPMLASGELWPRKVQSLKNNISAPLELINHYVASSFTFLRVEIYDTQLVNFRGASFCLVMSFSNDLKSNSLFRQSPFKFSKDDRRHKSNFVTGSSRVTLELGKSKGMSRFRQTPALPMSLMQGRGPHGLTCVL